MDFTRRIGLWAPPIAYMAIIFGFSNQSAPLPEVTPYLSDKLVHTIEYAVLGFLFSRALVGEGFGWLSACVLAFVATSGYGATDEWHQFYVPMRRADTMDWLADTLGALMGSAAHVAIGFGLDRRVS
jgi:VanZ family protein